MAEPVFPLEQFRLLFPQFDGVADEVVLANSEMALCFAVGRGCKCSEQMWLLLVAHLLAIAAAMAGGTLPAGPVVSASIGKVSVSVAAPPAGNDWSYWLAGSPYGRQFLALYQSCMSGGMYVGGRRERAGFRVVGGRFSGWRR